MTTPEPIDWRNLIQAGEDLLKTQGDSGPTDGHIRRAVSNAYYAMFHTLANSNAEVLIGSPRDDLTTAAWIRVYRGLEHNTARRAFANHRDHLSVEGEQFASTFIALQKRRHSADYDPEATFNIQDTSLQLAVAAYVCEQYLKAPQAERRCIAALTTIDRRRN